MVATTEYNKIQLMSFGRFFSSSKNVEEVFSAIRPSPVTFIDLVGIGISEEFLEAMLLGCLKKTDKIILSNATRSQRELIRKTVTKINARDRVRMI